MIVEKYTDYAEIPATFITEMDKTKPYLFGKLEWFNLLHKHIIEHNQEVIFYCVLNMQKKIEAIFPLIKSPNKNNSGYSLKSLANFYSMEYRPLIIKKSRNSRKAINAFVHYLATEERDWITLELFPIDEGELSNIYLKEELNKHFSIAFSLCHKNWVYRNNNEKYDDFITYSPSRVRSIKRDERRIKKDHEIQIKIWTDDIDIEECIQDYFLIYNNSWKNKEQYPEFIPELIRLCASEKILRLGILYVDNIPTAAQLNIFHDNITLIYKLSYHEEYKHLSTGAILSFHMMQYAFDKDKSMEIDYGCGDDAYKREWMDLCRKKMTMTTYNNNFRGKFLFLKQSLKTRIKQFLIPEKH